MHPRSSGARGSEPGSRRRPSLPASGESARAARRVTEAPVGGPPARPRWPDPGHSRTS